MSKRKLIFLFLVMFTVIMSGAGLSGQIIDRDNGERIRYANVILSSGQSGDQTNIDGVFRIRGLEQGIYIMEVSCLGYESIEMEIELVDEVLGLVGSLLS